MTFTALVRLTLVTGIVTVAAAYVILGARSPWDFATYYYAASALRSGLNPYSLGALSQVAGKRVDLPFIYPPVTLALFLPFTLLPVAVAGTVWLALKVVLMVPLVWVWKRFFLPDTNAIVLLATTLLGFNLALLWDLRTGNVAVVEAALIWFAFAFYLRGHTWLAAYIISVAALLKQLPLLLVGAIAVPPDSSQRKWILLASAVGFLTLSIALPPHLSAEWRRGLSTAAAAPRPTGDINPSALGLADWVTGTLELPMRFAPVLAFALYLVYCAILLLCSLGAMLRVQRSGSRAEQIVLLVLLWLLLSPRVMVYSYIMAIVPVLYVIETRIRPGGGRNAAVGIVLLQGMVRLLPGHPPTLLAPLSFLILGGAWILCLRPRVAGVPA